MNEVDELLLEHFGTKGMKWGIRKERDSSGFRSQTSGLTVDSSLSSSTSASAKKVASLISDRYGFRITEIKNLKTENLQEYQHGTAAFVKHTPGQQGGSIFITPDNLNSRFKNAENSGFMVKGTTNVEGLLTHESAHAMFHAEQKTTTGFFKTKTVGGYQKARDKALKAALKQAEADGILPNEFLSKISGYAKYANSREEAEAEMFSQYHWAANPQKFVKVWGETLHTELGIDSTPFKEAVKHG